MIALPRKYSFPQILLLLLLLLLLMFIVLRAVYVGFTHDEAYTFLNYVACPPEKTMRVDYTNNHLLNSMAMRWCYQWFGSSEFSLRLPNVIAGGVYLLFCRAWVMRLGISNWWRFAAFVCLSLNLAYFEFFSLSRGYGISIGLLAGSLYYTWRGFETGRFFPFATLSIIFLFAAAYANYTLANYLILLILFYAGWLTTETVWRIRKKKISFMYITGVLMTGVMTFFGLRNFLEMMFNLNELNNFSFGGGTGFITDTIASVILCNDRCFGLMNARFPMLFSYFTLIVFLIGSCWLFTRFREKRFGPEFGFGVFLIYMLTGCSVAIIAEHQLMNIPYSMDRTALYFLALFVFFLVTTLTNGSGTWKRLRTVMFFGWMIFPATAFIAKINLHYTNYWPGNTHTKKLVTTMIADSKQYYEKNIFCSISSSFDQWTVVNYYLFRHNAWWLNPIHFQDTGFYRNRNYIIASGMNAHNIDETAEPLLTIGKMRLLKHEPVPLKTDTADYENFENIVTPNRFAGRNGGYSERISEYHPFSAFLQDSFPDSINLCRGWQVEMYIHKVSDFARLSLVSCMMRGKNVLSWRQHPIYTHFESKDEWALVRMQVYIDTEPLPGDRFDVYVVSEFNAVADIADFLLRRLN